MSGDPLKGTVPALRVAISASIALSVMTVDFIWLMRDEVKFIWPRLRASWTARMYILARYLGLASQIFNVCFTVRMYLGIETTPAGCRFWFAYQALVVQFLLAFVEGMLMHRIYALFLKNRIVLMILIAFAMGQTASMWVSARLSFPSNKHTVTCLMVRSNPGNAFFSITTMTTNLAIFFMTFWRYLRLPDKWTRQGIGRIVFRDSTLSLTGISVMMLFMTLCSLQVIKPSMSGNITYYWFVCVLWISIGRLIVNHEKMLCSEREHGGLEFTSQFETDTVWTLEIPRCGKMSTMNNGLGQWQMTPTTPTTLTSTVRNSFLQTPTTKGGPLFFAPLSSSGCGSGGCNSESEKRGERSDLSPSGVDEDQHSSDRKPVTGPDIVKTEVSVPNMEQPSSSSSGRTGEGDAQRADEDADADEHERRSSPGPSLHPQPSDTAPVPAPVEAEETVPGASQSSPSSPSSYTCGNDVPRPRPRPHTDADEEVREHTRSRSPRLSCSELPPA